MKMTEKEISAWKIKIRRERMAHRRKLIKAVEQAETDFYIYSDVAVDAEASQLMIAALKKMVRSKEQIDRDVADRLVVLKKELLELEESK